MIIDVYKNILTISIKETYINQFYNFFIKVNRKFLSVTLVQFLSTMGSIVPWKIKSLLLPSITTSFRFSKYKATFLRLVWSWLEIYKTLSEVCGRWKWYVSLGKAYWWLLQTSTSVGLLTDVDVLQAIKQLNRGNNII